ncbi:8884_t:CDS:2, partial [Ambispora leptoticha]
SASSNVIEEKQAPTLAELVRKYDTEKLIEFLRGEEDLQLDEDDFKILRDEKITGRDFLKATKQDFRDYGMKGGPASRLVDFAKEVKEKKLRAFSSYHSLREVLLNYGLDSDGIESIPLFTLPTYEIQDNDKHFTHCMAEILKACKTNTLWHYSTLPSTSYGTTLKKKFSMRPQYEITGEKSTGRVDYAIKETEDLICITEDKQHKVPMGYAQNIAQLESSFETNKKKRKASEAFDDDDFDYLYGIVTTGRDWHFLLYSPNQISQGSKLPYTIEFTEDALKEESEEHLALRKSVKKVLGVIVALLEDRACVGKSPTTKRARVEGYRAKKMM